MVVSLLPAALRIGLVAALGACVVVAALSRWRRGPAGLTVAAASAAIVLALVLVGERLVAWNVATSVPPGDSFNEWRWVLSAPWGRVGIVAGIAVAAATVLLSFYGTRRETRSGRRALLVALRAGACGAALILFLEPALELRHVTREPNHIAILVDDSRSMELAETPGGETRADRAAKLVAGARATFRGWRDDHVLDFYTFSDTLAPAAESILRAPAPGRGDATLLREALEQIQNRYDSHDLAGVVVVSDGTPTGRFGDGVDDGASQDFLAALGTRVHTVWAGRPGLRDLAVARILTDEFAFVRTAVKIEAVIRATGLPAMDIPVVLRRDGVALRSRTVRVGGNAPEARVTFEIVPDRIGKNVYDVSVPVLAEESVRDNNVRAFVMRVIRDKIRVLQVAGRPSWDERALRAFFKSDPNVDLISFFILRTFDDLPSVPNHELSLIPFPHEELFEQELGSFDLIVFMDFELQHYQMRHYLENIRAYVEQGGALAMVGGAKAFSSGDTYGTPVAEALPVDLLPDTGSPSLYSTDDYRPRVTAEGLLHPVTQLRFDRRDNEARWGALPALEGLNFVAEPKAGSTVLLEHPSLRGRNGRPLPVLVTGEYGKGRTMALMTDASWRWGFVAAGQGDDGRAYTKFWENAVSWLIRDPDLEHLHIESDQAEYSATRGPRLAVRLKDQDYRPAAGVDVTVVLQRTEPRPETLQSLKVKTDTGGEATIDVPPLGAGAYRAAARAKLGDRDVVADDVFLVSPERAELERPEAREDILRTIAAVTGGQYLGPATSLPDDLPFTPPRVVRVDQKRDVELWSRPYLFALALGLLGAEWALRRRRGFL
jgi:uncharacterized membrane protein